MAGVINLDAENIPHELEVLKRLPLTMAKKPVQKTFRKAAQPLVKELRNNLPVKMKDLKRAIMTKNMKGLAVKAGIYTKRVAVTLRDGREYDAYYPLYWHNYGTLSKRNLLHTFKMKRKRQTAGWKGGITPQSFIEKTYETKNNEVGMIIERDFINNVRDFLNKQSGVIA